MVVYNGSMYAGGGKGQDAKWLEGDKEGEEDHDGSRGLDRMDRRLSESVGEGERYNTKEGGDGRGKLLYLENEGDERLGVDMGREKLSIPLARWANHGPGTQSSRRVPGICAGDDLQKKRAKVPRVPASITSRRDGRHVVDAASQPGRRQEPPRSPQAGPRR